MPTPAVDVRSLYVRFGQVDAVRGIDFSVDAGAATALLGRNGAGKSTTFRAILGLLARREGRIVFDGQDLSSTPTHEIVKAGLGYVPEDRRIFTELTVEENLEVGRQRARAGAPAWTPDRLYGLFPNLGTMRDRPGGRMSGGEQQMLTIGRALMTHPELILIDEATEGLAPLIAQEIWRMIDVIRSERITTIVVDKDFKSLARIADRAVVHVKGEVAFDGSPAARAAQPDLLNRYLGV